MFDRLKKLLGRASSPASFSDEDYDRWYELKRRGLEYVLGPMYEMVSHGVIPFFLGGRLDIYFFPGPSGGTALVSMELIEPNGSGPKRSKIGTYELIAFTKHWIGDEAARQAFDVMLPRLS
ncbi:MAG TPA: hypothetical protein ENO16_06475, partial [Chromatiales bacterium]|nr:hypothetical protein [Chromatiales bacterium]